MAKSNKTIVWFRNDLRIQDNPALSYACEQQAKVIPLFLWCPEDHGRWAPGEASQWWLRFSLQSLDTSLKNHSSCLVLKSGKTYEEALIQTILAENVTAVYWNRGYEPHGIERDQKIKSRLSEMGIEAKSFASYLLYEPWEIENQQKKPYQVFTPFFKKCLQISNITTPLTIPTKIDTPKRITSEKLESWNLSPKIPWDVEFYKFWKVGEDHAHKKLANFFHQEKMVAYNQDRDFPALPGTSELAPHLHFGEITARQIFHYTYGHLLGKNPADVLPFLRQLFWRDFSWHLLYHFPHTDQEPLQDKFRLFPWRDDLKQLKFWQQGKTGYPFVDAGMRQLYAIGWMHNRVRMVVGSFLVKNLMMHWKHGADWFWDTLVDADLGNNTMGWQWVGGSGADAAPYFRIFNPITQSKKFDRNGDYIRRWVPELAKLPKKYIHEPWLAPHGVLEEAGVRLGENYPLPIVDHGEARKRALAAFQGLKS